MTFSDILQYRILVFFASFIIICFLMYIIYLSFLRSRECSYINDIYKSVNGYIKSIDSSDETSKYTLLDYYIKTAYNCCSGGSYSNDYVDLCQLKAILRQGVRALDFEIYSYNDDPIISTNQYKNNYHIKQTYNYILFNEAMKIITSYGFTSGNCPNPTDPILIHLRIQSKNNKLYDNLALIFQSYNNYMLGKEYSYESDSKNIGNVPIVELLGKIILIIDRTNTSFLENEQLLEYVNMTSNSVFCRLYRYSGIQNNPDINELTEYNKKNMTIVLPDIGNNPDNPNAIISYECGCQMVAMRYSIIDSNLEQNIGYFDEHNTSFSLKPENLRYIPVVVDDPTPQNPNYSYETRPITSDYYNFNI